MQVQFFKRWAFTGLIGLCSLAPVAARAQAPETITKDDIISGTMDITFETRTNMDRTGDLKEGSAAVGAKDKYVFTLNVAETTQFAGEITRQGKLATKILGRNKQEAQLWYNVNLFVLNPKDLKQKKAVGKWVGTMPVDPATGVFDLAGGKSQDSALRINIDATGKQEAFVDTFSGRLAGKSEKKDGLVASTYKRIIGDKTVEYKTQKSDPMRFENITLAKGPANNYPKTTVNGRLDYDYETGNYFADNIRFNYNADGKDVEDVVTGTIKWVEDPNRTSNGKGAYEFNIRFNEAKNKTGGNEAAAFEKMAAEDAFFAVDTSVPTLTGKISYIDTMTGSGDKAVPASSKVTYSLNANKLTKQQVMNFFKLWMIAVGPTNDE